MHLLNRIGLSKKNSTHHQCFSIWCSVHKEPIRTRFEFAGLFQLTTFNQQSKFWPTRKSRSPWLSLPVHIPAGLSHRIIACKSHRAASNANDDSLHLRQTSLPFGVKPPQRLTIMFRKRTSPRVAASIINEVKKFYISYVKGWERIVGLAANVAEPASLAPSNFETG